MSLAQDQDYTPPPMFDSSATMVRPETSTGNLFEPKSSANMRLDNAPLPRPAAIAPRITTTVPAQTPPSPVLPASQDSGFQEAPALPAPAVESTPTMPKDVSPQATTIVPAAKKMQPIVDEKDIAREKSAKTEPETKKPQKTTERKSAEKKPVAKSVEDTPEQPEKTKSVVEPAIAETSADPAKQANTQPEPVAVSEEPPASVDKRAPEIEKPEAPVTPQKTALPVTTEKPSARPSEDDRTQVIKAKAVPRESAIKGPKTMPSIPTENVDAQETFAEEKAAPAAVSETIMQRHQKSVEADHKAKEQIPAAVAPPPGVTPVSFQTADHGALKRTIPFQPGQVGLSKEQATPIAAGVFTEVGREDRKEWRVQIRSYATSFGAGLSSDRRISLSRALSLRTNLIENGIPANRIDIIAEGAEGTGGEAADRIDLLLYSPAS